MQRLLLSFILVFILVTALLTYFLHSAYQEERSVLVERLEADLREGQAERLMRQVRGLRGISVNEQRDSFINLRLKQPDERVNALDWGTTVPTPEDDGSTMTFTFTDPRDSTSWSPPQTIRLHSKADAVDLDTLSRKYGITLVNFASIRDAERADALPINPPKQSLLSARNKEIVGALDYQYTLLTGLGYEAAFALLLLTAIGFAFYTAFVSLEEQQRQLRERESLIANVAHELKTPIATVGVALEALDSFGADLEPTRRREYLELSRSELGRLDRMADRAIASLEYENLSERMTVERVDLTDLTRQAWRGLALRHQLPESTLTIESDHPGTVGGDAHYLFHAIYNLLDNAVKYGGQPPEILVRVRPGAGRSVRYGVHDNGKGIPPALADRVFERFFRGGGADGHRVKGHGLGLSFVRQIVGAHGGSVRAGTGVAGGGFVEFNLPRP